MKDRLATTCGNASNQAPETTVRALRRIKERRQVILATHNANIAVLGDSDQVIPLKATADRSIVMPTGTVEHPKTREYVCEILEGGKDAYKRRGAIYGLD